MIPAMAGYSGVKTFRVLRALKTISTVKGISFCTLITDNQHKNKSFE